LQDKTLASLGLVFLGGIFLSLDEMNKRGKQNQLSEQVCEYMVEAKIGNGNAFPGNWFPFPK
jgi:hypothetical protein